MKFVETIKDATGDPLKRREALLKTAQERLAKEEECVRKLKSDIDDATSDLTRTSDEDHLAKCRVAIREMTPMLDRGNAATAKLRLEIQALETDIARIKADLAEKAEIERLRAIPAAREDQRRAAVRVEQLAKELGEAMRDHVAKSEHLARVVGAPLGGVLSRVHIERRHCMLYKYFGHEPPLPNGLLADWNKRFLTRAMAYSEYPDSALGFVALERRETAEIGAFFASRRDAEDLRKEIDPTGELVHSVQDPRTGLWLLRHGRLRFSPPQRAENQGKEEPSS